MTAGAVLGFAVLMETAIAMVLLSRVLKYGANRWANIIVGIIHTAAVFLFAVCRNAASSLLCVLCDHRNRLYFVHYLVCVEVAQP